MSFIFDSTADSIVCHFTPQHCMPNAQHTAVATSSAICDGPVRESLPKIVTVAVNWQTSTTNGMALRRNEGDFCSGLLVSFCDISCVEVLLNIRCWCNLSAKLQKNVQIKCKREN